MGEGVDSPGPDERQKALHIDPRGFDQMADQQTVGIDQGNKVERIIKLAGVLYCDIDGWAFSGIKLYV